MARPRAGRYGRRVVTLETLSASETAGLAANAPVLVGANALELTTQEVWSSTGELTTGVVEARRPVANARDLRGAPSTEPIPDGATPTTWSLVWELEPNNRAVDCAGVFGTNFASLFAATGGDTYQLRLECADNSAFTVGLETPFFWNVNTISLGLGLGYRFGGLFAQRVRGARYWRLRLINTSGPWPALLNLPRIGEVWLGRRHQMPFPPQRPLDWDATDAEEDSFFGAGGARVGATEWRGRGVWPLVWRLRQDAQGVEARDVLRAWWRDARDGAEALMFTQPAVNASVVYMVQDERRALSAPEITWQVSEARLQLVEQPPFFVTEREVIGE